jgi:hypothetical protein
MIVFFNGFWNGFIENTDPNKSFVLLNILEKTFNEKITLGNENNSDILVESVFSDKTFINYKKWRYTFLFNGESIRYLFEKKYKRFALIPNYNCILSGRFTDSNKKLINFPLFVYYIYSNNYFPLLTNNIKIDIAPKKHICAIISNGNSSIRNTILDKIGKYIKIDYAGRFRNNVPRLEGDYNSRDMLNFYSQYKFVICLENTKQETYITEKIINGFLAKTIPIYWGSDKITDYFNDKRFINIPNIEDNTFINVIKKLLLIINNDEEYLKIVNEPIFKDNLMPRSIDNIVEDIKILLGK